METILIIADQMDNCRLFAEELAFDGYTVILIGHPVNIQEEVNLSLPDLILIDLYMKGEERWGLLREIKARNPHLPMLMVTAFEKNLGQPLTPAEGIFSKKIYFSELRKKIGEILEEKWLSPLSAASGN